MSILGRKQTGPALLHSPRHLSSHRIRLVCQAKELEIEYIEINPDVLPEDLLELNPTGKLPTLIDRDLTIFNDRVVSEYLDERFPHPALMPIEANARAKIRLFCMEVEDVWYPCVDALEHEKLSLAKRKAAVKTLRDGIVQFSPMLRGAQKFVLNNELSLLDCCILPVLWRLESIGVDLPKNSAVQLVKQYMKYHFTQEYFKRSLSSYERTLFDPQVL